MFSLESLLPSFMVVSDHPDLSKRYKKVEHTVLFSCDGRTFQVSYGAWVNLMSPKDVCIGCGRPAEHVCVITIRSLADCTRGAPKVLHMHRSETKVLREIVEEFLCHHQPICLLDDCICPPRISSLSPA